MHETYESEVFSVDIVQLAANVEFHHWKRRQRRVGREDIALRRPISSKVTEYERHERLRLASCPAWHPEW